MALVLKRCIHSTSPVQGVSPLFHLQALSNARETARAAQLSRLPRTAHSTQLQLLQAEASVAPLDSDGIKKPVKDATRDPVLPTSEPSMPSLPSQATGQTPLLTSKARDEGVVVTKQDRTLLTNGLNGGVARELQSIRKELGEWQASVDDRLAMISYDLKRMSSNQGSSGWLVAFGALFFICSWGLVTLAAEKKIQKAAEPPIHKPSRTRPPTRRVPPPPAHETPLRSPEPTEQAPPPPKPTPPIAQSGQSGGWFW